jgi:hypothetical protein
VHLLVIGFDGGGRCVQACGVSAGGGAPEGDATRPGSESCLSFP